MGNSLDAYAELHNMQDWRRCKPPDNLLRWRAAICSAIAIGIEEGALELIDNLPDTAYNADAYQVNVRYDKVVSDIDTLSLVEHPGKLDILIVYANMDVNTARPVHFDVYNDPFTHWYTRLCHRMHYALGEIAVQIARKYQCNSQ